MHLWQKNCKIILILIIYCVLINKQNRSNIIPFCRWCVDNISEIVSLVLRGEQNDTRKHMLSLTRGHGGAKNNSEEHQLFSINTTQLHVNVFAICFHLTCFQWVLVSLYSRYSAKYYTIFKPVCLNKIVTVSVCYLKLFWGNLQCVERWQTSCE